MDSVNVFIVVAAVAWMGQIALGWRQISCFNRALETLSQRGQVCIGRSTGRFKPRVILALAVNDDGRISDNLVMKGVTVFSRPASESALTGRRLDDLCPERLFPGHKALQEALTLAITNKR